MIQEARVKNNHADIEYHVGAIEELQVDYQFDFIFSSLTLHYVEHYRDLVKKVYSMLKSQGSFLFVVEHPIFTAQGQQEWIMGDDGVPLHWPVDRYYDESWRESNFLDTKIKKFHRSMSSYVNPIIEEGFTLEPLTEVIPPSDWVSLDPRNADELRRSMMLIIKVTKK